MGYDEEFAHGVRVESDATDDALSRSHTRLFNMTGPWVARGVRFARTRTVKG
jgi:hypothetical protein